MSDDIHVRLFQARREAGYSGPNEAASALGWNKHTYKSHENGTRGLRDQDTVRRYARAFGVDFNWLLTGIGSAEPRTILAIAGRIGAGAEIHVEMEQQGGQEDIELPFPVPADALAFEVEGDSMWPRYDDGDVVITGRQGTDARQIVNWEAAVRLTDGRRFLKRVVAGSAEGFFNLESHNAATIRDVQIEWAAQIDHVVRRGQWKALDAAARKRLVARTMKKSAKL